MAGGTPSIDPHGQLHQLQMCKLLQCKDLVLCPEGLIGQMETSQFTFKELPIWNAAAPSKLQLIVVDLSSTQPEDVTAIPQTPHSMLVLPPPPTDTTEPFSDITAAINLQLMGIQEWLQQASPIAPTSISQQSMSRKQPPSAALGALLAVNKSQDSFRPEGMDTGTMAPVASFTPTILIMMQMSLHVPIPTGALSSAHATPWPIQPTLPKTLQMLSHPFLTQPQATTKGRPTGFPDKLLQLQEKMNVAQEWLLTNMATMGFWSRELELNTELVACLNDAQAAEAIREVKVQCKNMAYALQQAHQDNVLVLEHEAKVTEEQDCQAFAEAFRVAVWTCLLESWGTLLYQLQILTGDAPLAAIFRMSATAQLWAVAGRGMVPTPPNPSVSETPMSQLGRKCSHCSSDQSAPALKGLRQDEEEAVSDGKAPEEHPDRKCKEVKALKEPRKEAFSKESNIVKGARWVYQKTHQANFEQERWYDLSPIFCQMATSTNLLNAEVH